MRIENVLAGCVLKYKLLFITRMWVMNDSYLYFCLCQFPTLPAMSMYSLFNKDKKFLAPTISTQI